MYRSKPFKLKWKTPCFGQGVFHIVVCIDKPNSVSCFTFRFRRTTRIYLGIQLLECSSDSDSTYVENTILHTRKDFAVSPLLLLKGFTHHLRNGHPTLSNQDVTARTSMIAHDGRYPLRARARHASYKVHKVESYKVNAVCIVFITLYTFCFTNCVLRTLCVRTFLTTFSF